MHCVEGAEDLGWTAGSRYCLDNFDLAGVEEEAESGTKAHHAALCPEDGAPGGEGDDDAA